MSDQFRSFCTSCGTQFAGFEEFCRQCGAARVAPSAAPAQNPYLLAPPKPPRRWPKVVLATLVVLGLLGAGYGGYWYMFQRYDYAARSVLALVYANQGRADDIINSGCTALNAKLDSLAGPLAVDRISYELDYTEALGESPRLGEVESALDDWANGVLRLKMGEKIAKLKYPEQVRESLYTAAGQSCRLSTTPQQVLDSAKALDKVIQAINYPPSNWAGSGWSRSLSDPNIAYRWANRYSYSCNYYAEVCVGIQVKVHRACAYNVRAEVGWKFSTYGSVVDTDTGTVSSARKGRIYTIVINSYLLRYSSVTLNSVSCG